MELIGGETRNPYLQTFVAQLDTWIQRDKSDHTVKLRYACVWSYIYGLSGYMVIVANGDDDRCI
jgi:hypothetical protein